MRGGTGGTEVDSGPSPVPGSVSRSGTGAVESMTVERIAPTLVLHPVPGRQRWLSGPATDVHAAG